jgi:DNA-binding TFAR19-related protein (PDSD5 family)
MDSDYVTPSHTQPLQLAQSLAMAATITEADLIEMLHELAERRRADVLG